MYDGFVYICVFALFACFIMVMFLFQKLFLYFSFIVQQET